MKTVDVTLLDSTSLTLAARAAKLCIGKEWTGGDRVSFLRTLIQRGHESVLEHVVYVFAIDGISRACLQQLSRHRHTSPSVKSTRWALKAHGDFFVPPELTDEDRNEYVSRCNSMISYGRFLADRYGNDVGKYALPECLQTDEILTMNLRELRHIYFLRACEAAMPEIAELARKMVACLPGEDQELARCWRVLECTGV